MFEKCVDIRSPMVHNGDMTYYTILNNEGKAVTGDSTREAAEASVERLAHYYPKLAPLTIREDTELPIAVDAETLANWIKCGKVLPPGECAGCDRDIAYNPSGYFPRHTASQRCQSGARPHCTCDTCF